jgi:hypothetical protein
MPSLLHAGRSRGGPGNIRETAPSDSQPSRRKVHLVTTVAIATDINEFCHSPTLALHPWFRPRVTRRSFPLLDYDIRPRAGQ